MDQLFSNEIWPLYGPEGIAQHKSLLWPSSDGQWLLYGVLNTSRCYHLDYIDYLDDWPKSHSIRYAAVNIVRISS